MLDRFSHLGFVFFEDVNVDIRGDFGIAMTEVLEKTKSPAEAELFVYRNNPKWVIISSRTVRTAVNPQKQLSVVFSPNDKGLTFVNLSSSEIIRR